MVRCSAISPTAKTSARHAGIIGEYRFQAWLALIGQAGYLADFTDFEYLGAATDSRPGGKLQRFDAWLGLRVFY